MLYHIAPASFVAPGTTIEPESLDTEGFVHCSTWSQLPGVAGALFKGQEGMIVLEIDPELVESPIRNEDLYDAGQEFPHIYGPIPGDAVTGIMDLQWPDGGQPLFTRLDTLTDPDSSELDEISSRSIGGGSHPTDADIEILSRLNAQLIEDEGHSNVMNRDQLAHRMRGFLSGTYVAYVFQEGDLVLGYALVDHSKRPLYLRQFFVQRGLRRMGFGRLTFLMLAAQLGSPAIGLEVLTRNNVGRSFWHSLGFGSNYMGLVRRTAGGPETIHAPLANTAGVHTGAEEESHNTAADLAFTTRVGDVTAEAEFVHQGIKQYNDSISPPHKAARQTGAITNASVMLTADGRWVGGVVASIYWDWLEVDDLWIAEPFRRSGHGTELLARIEKTGSDRGAKHVQLKTFSFQARGFYEKQGYTVIGELRDYPEGSSLYWLRKEL